MKGMANTRLELLLVIAMLLHMVLIGHGTLWFALFSLPACLHCNYCHASQSCTLRLLQSRVDNDRLASSQLTHSPTRLLARSATSSYSFAHVHASSTQAGALGVELFGAGSPDSATAFNVLAADYRFTRDDVGFVPCSRIFIN